MRLFLLAACLALAGCSSGPNQAEKDKSRPEDKFDVTRPGATFLDGTVVVGTMKLPSKGERFDYYEAEIENRGTAALSLEFRTTWKDASDKPLGTGAWQAFEIPAGRKAVIGDETTDFPDARFVKLEVRPRS